MNDPQNAPDYYQHVERVMVDTEGVRIVLLIDQDGEETVMEEQEWLHGADRL